MKTLVILAHPNIEQSVANKYFINALSQVGGEITVHNLYKTYPDWKIDVAAEQNLLLQHDRILFQFPVQWFNMPPLLKKWMDDVLAYGWCYGPDGDKMLGKKIGVLVTTGGPEVAYQIGGQNKYPLDYFLSNIESSAIFIRSQYIGYHAFHSAMGASEEALKAGLPAYLDFVKNAK